jgi:hypothetical protein
MYLYEVHWLYSPLSPPFTSPPPTDTQHSQDLSYRSVLYFEFQNQCSKEFLSVSHLWVYSALVSLTLFISHTYPSPHTHYQQLSVCFVLSSSCTNTMYFFLIFFSIIYYCAGSILWHLQIFLQYIILEFTHLMIHTEWIVTWLGNLPWCTLPEPSMLDVPLDNQGRHLVHTEMSAYPPCLTN